MTSPEGPRPPRDDSDYVSPYAEFESSDPAEADRAGDAMEALMERYLLGPHIPEANDGRMGAFKTMIGVIRAYSQASIRAAAEGHTDEARAAYIKDELKKDAHIDPEDSGKADKDYRIISEGYDLNRAYWDMHLGRERRYRQDIRLMDEELGNK